MWVPYVLVFSGLEPYRRAVTRGEPTVPATFDPDRERAGVSSEEERGGTTVSMSGRRVETPSLVVDESVGRETMGVEGGTGGNTGDFASVGGGASRARVPEQPGRE